MFYDFYRLLLYSCVCQLLIKFMMMMKWVMPSTIDVTD